MVEEVLVRVKRGHNIYEGGCSRLSGTVFKIAKNRFLSLGDELELVPVSISSPIQTTAMPSPVLPEQTTAMPSPDLSRLTVPRSAPRKKKTR